VDVEKVTKIAEVHAASNALKYDGKPNVNAVLRKLMAEVPELQNDPKTAYALSSKACTKIVGLSIKEMQEFLKQERPELLVKKKQERDFTLPALFHAVEGKVITRFPPEPNGYLHIGHAKAAIIDHEYARTYHGTFILRFDDTNPVNEAIEFYDAQKEDLRWLGVEWDVEYRTSDNLPKHYALAEMLIKKGCAYICSCSEKSIKENRKRRRECACRNTMTPEKWDEFFSMEEGKAVLRLKGNLKSENTAMRDPTLFRIIDQPHPIHERKYRIWPTYDFSGPIEDSLSGVTHPFRTKEYELRDEVYFYLLDCLNLRKPHLMEFARLSIEGMPVSKREIKPLIANKFVRGWDDPRLPTLRGLKRRGICTEAIHKFIMSQGVSKAEAVVTFDQIEATNRKILDPKAKRFFFIPNPIKLIVSDAPKKRVVLEHHPSNNLGSRELVTSGVFFIPHQDVHELKKNEVFRLKDLYNVKVTEKRDEVLGEFVSIELEENIKKIQWVTDEYVKMNVIIPEILFVKNKFNKKSLGEIRGYAEKSAERIAHGEIAQFERFGFVRVEKNNEMSGILAHK
jgi:glutamyl-tRNA synthetase